MSERYTAHEDNPNLEHTLSAKEQRDRDELIKALQDARLVANIVRHPRFSS